MLAHMWSPFYSESNVIIGSYYHWEPGVVMMPTSLAVPQVVVMTKLTNFRYPVMVCLIIMQSWSTLRSECSNEPVYPPVCPLLYNAHIITIHGSQRPWKVLEFDFSMCLENWQFSLKSAWKLLFMGLKINGPTNLTCLCLFMHIVYWILID